MRFWMLMLGIVRVSVFSDLYSAISRYYSTVATAEESEPDPTPTPAPEADGYLR